MLKVGSAVPAAKEGILIAPETPNRVLPKPTFFINPLLSMIKLL
jgi:hypothetical protein